MTHRYTAALEWQRNGANFADGNYSRAHTWRFDGGAVVPASASPLVVPVPHADPAGVDPEEAYVAALASCHFLWFLHVARVAGFVVDGYRDEATGIMEKNAQRKLWISRVTLRPEARFAGSGPDRDRLLEMHHRAHAECFIANSVRTAVVVEPVV